jgi:hypothetical protein
VGERVYLERTFEPRQLFCPCTPLGGLAVGVSALKPSSWRISSVLAAQE